MGGLPSKIKDEQRIKIYKRVTVEEAREKFKHLSSEVKESILSSKHLSTLPISRNFDLYYGYLDQISYLNHFECGMKGMMDDEDGIRKYLEVDGCHLFLGYRVIPLNVFLESKQIVYNSYTSQVPAINQKQKDSFLIGLSKDQYSLLFEKAKAEVETEAKQIR